MKYKMYLGGYGGEYAFGKVYEEETMDNIRQQAEDGEIKAWNWDEDSDYELNFYEHDDYIHISNVAFDGMWVEIFEQDENGNDGKQVFEDYGDFRTANEDNPYIDPKELEENKEDGVIGYYGGASLEKGCFSQVYIDVEDFDPNNLLFLTINMDETLCGDEIVSTVLYISPDQLAEEYDKFYGEENYFELTEEDDPIDYFNDFTYDVEQKGQNFMEILEKYILEMDYDCASTDGKSSFGVAYDADYNEIEA